MFVQYVLKNSFLLPHLFCNVEFEFSRFHNTKQSSEMLILEIEMLPQFQNKTNIKILIQICQIHIQICQTDIPSKYFVCLHNVFKTSSRHVFKTSSRHVFKTSSRHVFKTSLRHVFKTSSKHVFKTFSRHVLKTSSRRFQRNNFSSSKTSSRGLGRRKIVTLKKC